MRIKHSIGQQVFNFFNAIIMLIMIIATLYPVFYVTFASFSDAAQLAMHKGLLLRPLGFDVGAYKLVAKYPMILGGYMNTIFIVCVGVCINIVLTSIGAYFLSRKGVIWKKFVMLFVVFSMFFQGGLIPFYITVKNLGLENTYWAIILPSAINTFNLIIMRTAFMSIPESLEESAKLDGAGHIVILWKIVLPLSKATISVMVLYYAVAHWNSWFNAMIFLKDRQLYPLQLILREILIQNDTSSMTMGVSEADSSQVSEAVKYAVIVVATLPIVCVYPFLQKYFVKGVMVGAVKG